MSKATEIQRASPNRRSDIQIYQEQVKLSLKQSGFLPQHLSSAPRAIFYLGRIRLYSFSDVALKINLQPPAKGFSHLRYTSLPAVMQQLINQAAKAFQRADQNMFAVELEIDSLFGRSSVSTDIIRCLQNPAVAKRRLGPSMVSLRDGMDRCSKKATEIKEQFAQLLDVASELNLALSEQMNINELEKEGKRHNLAVQRTKEERQRATCESFAERYKKDEEELRKARKKYKKAGRNMEAKALGAKTLADIQGNLSGILSGAVGIIRESPQIIISSIQAAGALGGATYSAMSTGMLPPRPQRPVEDQTQSTRNLDHRLSPDPAVLAAEQICDQVEILHGLINSQDLLRSLQESDAEQPLIDCFDRLSSYSDSLGSYQSQHVDRARSILGRVNKLAESIWTKKSLASSTDGSSEEWQNHKRTWSNEVQAILTDALRLKAFAVAQPGRSFGAQLSSPDAMYGETDLNSFRRAYEHRYLIQREAVRASEERLRKITDDYKLAQDQVIQAVHSMKQLRLEAAGLEDIKQFLKETIDCIQSFEREIETLSQTFFLMSAIIDTNAKPQADRFLQTVEDAADPDMRGFGLENGEMEAQRIRGILLEVSSYFSVIRETARMYRGISQEYILPCLAMSRSLQVGATHDQQEQALNGLQNFTQDSARSIAIIAQKELDSMKNQIMIRVQELDDELQGFKALPEIEKAIREGNDEAEQSIREAYEHQNSIDDPLSGGFLDF